MAKKQAPVGGVTIEWDDVKHSKVNVKEGGFDKNTIPKGVGDDFTPSRIVVDLKLDLGDANATQVNLNDVHLKIPYTGTGPKVGWWNGKKWVKFDDAHFSSGIIDVTLPSPWPTDPPIGVYP